MRRSKQELLFPAVCSKPVIAAFDGGDVTSDAGLLLLQETDRHLGITQALVSSMEDLRQRGKVKHSIEEMVKARVYGIAQGYSDCNDFDRLREDPAFKVSCGSSPQGEALASQPTLSRFENRITARQNKQAREELCRAVLQQVPQGTPLVILEVDATDDPCHGQQQLQLFNGYYQEHCYVPLLVHLLEPGGTEHPGRRHLLYTLLRAGNASSGKGLPGLMRQVFRLVREHLGQQVLILVRADSGFGTEKFIEFLSKEKVHFVLGLPSNQKLVALAEQTFVRAATGYFWYGERYRVFGGFEYGAKTWQQKQRVVVKVEITQRAFNPRYVVTNLKEGDPEEIYAFYCDRGEQENRIKELKLDMDSGRTSCSRFEANQFRLLLHTAAYALMNGLRGILQEKQRQMGRLKMGRLQIGTLRLQLLKVGARVVESNRRVWFHLPSSYPYQKIWEQLVRWLCGNGPRGSQAPSTG